MLEQRRGRRDVPCDEVKTDTHLPLVPRARVNALSVPFAGVVFDSTPSVFRVRECSMKVSARLPLAGAGLLVAISVLCGCGSSSSASSVTPPPPAAIEGIATPSSVAVVTATNAN